MSDKEFCPRSYETGGGPNSPFTPPFNGEMLWRADDTCSHCGSMNPDTLLKRIAADDIMLCPTDKSYKVYVKNKGGEPLLRTYRKCPQGSDCTGPDDCTHWVTEETSQSKFYFQHFSVEQRKEFIRLLNERKVHISSGLFHVLPFFCTTAEPKGDSV